MIREAFDSDEGRILSLVQDAGVFNSIEVKTVKEIWQDYLSEGEIENGYHFLVIGQNDNIQGFACYGERPLTKGTYDLYWIVIAPDQRRKGFGRALLQCVEQDVLSCGGRLIIIETSCTAEYASTREFYLKSGYGLEARIRDFYHPNDDLMIYTKHLK